MQRKVHMLSTCRVAPSRLGPSAPIQIIWKQCATPKLLRILGCFGPPSILTTVLTGILMVKARRAAANLKVNANPPDPPGPDASQCPTRSTAGKGGHLTQLQRVALVIETLRPNAKRPASANGGSATNDPVNLMAPTQRRQT